MGVYLDEIAVAVLVGMLDGPGVGVAELQQVLQQGPQPVRGTRAGRRGEVVVVRLQAVQDDLVGGEQLPVDTGVLGFGLRQLFQLKKKKRD